MRASLILNLFNREGQKGSMIPSLKSEFLLANLMLKMQMIRLRVKIPALPCVKIRYLPSL